GGGRTDPRRGLRGVRPGGVAGGAGAGAGHRDRRVRRGAHRPQAAARAVEGADRRLRYAHRRDPADPGVHLDQRATNPAGHWSGRPPVTRATSRRLPRPSGRPRPPTPRYTVRPSPEPASPRRPSGTVPIGTGRGTGHHRTRPAGAASTSSTLAGSLSHCARPPAAPPPEHHAGALPPEAPGAPRTGRLRSWRRPRPSPRWRAGRRGCYGYAGPTSSTPSRSGAPAGRRGRRAGATRRAWSSTGRTSAPPPVWSPSAP